MFLILLGIGIVYWLWSAQEWRQYEQRPASLTQLTAERWKSALGQPSNTADEKAVRLEGFQRIAAGIADQATACRVNDVVDWQQRAFGLKSRERCEGIMRKLGLFKEALGQNIAYFEAESAIAKVFGDAPDSSGQIDEKQWSDHAEKWRGIKSALDKLSVAPIGRPLRQVAVERAEAMVIAWERIISESQAHSKVEFVKARAGLSEAHAALQDALITTSRAQMSKAAAEVTQAASSL